MPIDCLNETSECSKNGGCAQRDLWIEVRSAILKVLEGTTIADLADKELQAALSGGRYAI